MPLVDLLPAALLQQVLSYNNDPPSLLEIWIHWKFLQPGNVSSEAKVSWSDAGPQDHSQVWQSSGRSCRTQNQCYFTVMIYCTKVFRIKLAKKKKKRGGGAHRVDGAQRPYLNLQYSSPSGAVQVHVTLLVISCDNTWTIANWRSSVISVWSALVTNCSSRLPVPTLRDQPGLLMNPIGICHKSHC